MLAFKYTTSISVKILFVLYQNIFRVCCGVFQRKLLMEWEIEHYESILTPLDENIPNYFDLFWKWQEHKMLSENWSIFDPNFKVWLRHLKVVEPIKKSPEKNEFTYTPRNPYDDSDEFSGRFTPCAEKITKWVKKLFPISTIPKCFLRSFDQHTAWRKFWVFLSQMYWILMMMKLKIIEFRVYKKAH